jgi:hypothetical protein
LEKNSSHACDAVGELGQPPTFGTVADIAPAKAESGGERTNKEANIGRSLPPSHSISGYFRNVFVVSTGRHSLSQFRALTVLL